MTKIIELAHTLGLAIAESDEIKALEIAKDAYEADAALQAKLSEYETDRKLLTEEFVKEDVDEEAKQAAVQKLRDHMEALAAEIVVNEKYVAFTNAQQALNDLMAEVNAEIKFCITGERPSTCTHDCSTCGGCSH
ncbi:MAG: YlbF family regulator [Clostridia bacterium]|nr:YlbF family regulator [Clostridia bacterium]